VKYAFIRDVLYDNGLPLNRLLALVQVSTSGYYDWLKRRPCKRFIENAHLDNEIAKVYWKHRGLYGYRRVYAELLALGIYTGSRERIRRRMRHLDLRAVTKKRFKPTTDSHHNKPIAANLIKQKFVMGESNQAWVSDITAIRVGQKWLYFAVMIDLYSRKVIGWAMDKCMKASLVCGALKMALQNRGYPKGVIVHSDSKNTYTRFQ